MDVQEAVHRGPVVEIEAADVVELIDREVAAHPHAPAVVQGDRVVSYAELDRLADAAAWRLSREYAVGRGDVVLIAADAGIDFTAVVVATLRTGAAYLPVDMTYPAERVASILDGSAAKLTVTGAVARVPGSRRRATFTELTASDASQRFPRAGLAASDRAYLIFTSGSTGVPKGIIQKHGCLVNFVSWQVEATSLGRGRRVLQAAPLSFDVSVQEMFYTLASGGCLYVPDPRVKQDPRDLMRFIIDNDIEVVDFPQSFIEALMTLPVSFADAPSLRHIISAGETVRVTPALARLLRDRPELTMHNHYGPAETQMVTAHEMNAVQDNLEERPPVGSPVWNTYVCVLDDQRRPVPDGQVGEVYIGGAGVGLGYTDVELTKRVFLPDPFELGAWLYRTRDRGRWREDGTVELLGRVDDLIKIRGFSVEPREVEEHIASIDNVSSAAVYGHTRLDGTVELHAAVTGDPPPVARLRGSLLAALPDYMVPARWWLVDALPISPNGKMDRKALPGARPRQVPLSAGPHQSKLSP